MKKLIVILGPTASSKTQLAVNLAHCFNGEIISADSRQVYKGMDIGTGKDLDEYIYQDTNIPYHLIDILNPMENYSVFQFKNDFFKSYSKIVEDYKVPILCGGTGLYLESVLLNYKMSTTGPNHKLRKILEKLTIEDLCKYLINLSPNSYDAKFHITKRRLVRSIEIVHPDTQNRDNKLINKVIKDVLVIGIKMEREILLRNIKKRLYKRLDEGMIDEVKLLVQRGMTLDRLSYFGLEYKFVGQFLFNKISYDEMVTSLNTAINRFSKKQMTFFRRMEKRGIEIQWFDPGFHKEIIENVTNYLR